MSDPEPPVRPSQVSCILGLLAASCVVAVVMLLALYVAGLLGGGL